MVRRWHRVLALAGSLMLAMSARSATPLCGTSDFSSLNHFESAFSATVGPQRILFYRVRFLNDTGDPGTSVEADAAMQQVRDAFRTMSYGLLQIEWVISPVLDLPNDAAWYGHAGLLQLVEDAQLAARKAGLNHLDFDRDLVRSSPPPEWDFDGQAVVRGREAWIAESEPTLIVHELGHTLGLEHANSWENLWPDTSRTSPPFPSDYAKHPTDLRFDPDSLVRRASILSPGWSVEYGDPFDVMGSGLLFDPNGSGLLTGDLNAHSKLKMGWLAESNVALVCTSGVYRLFTFNTSTLQPGRAYALRLEPQVTGRMPFDEPIQYWIQYRTMLSMENSVQLHWVDLEQKTHGLLIDTTPDTVSPWFPGCPWCLNDTMLMSGRAFHDPLAQVRMVPLARGGTGEDRWFDVAVALGSQESNIAPELLLSASALMVEPGERVDFTATASDRDGDPVAFFWEFSTASDATASTGGTNQVASQWFQSGEYIVRCEATDSKGATTTRRLVVRVGQPSTWKISGRVADSSGRPLPGCRVHNGRITDSGKQPDYVYTITDSAGEYVLICQSPGPFFPAAYTHGYQLTSPRPGEPVSPPSNGTAIVNFTLSPIPEISAFSAVNSASEGDSNIIFMVVRSGSVDHPLLVWFHIGGSANPSDYAGLDEGTVEIPSGTNAAFLAVTLQRDFETEPVETLVLTLTIPPYVEREIVNGPTTNRVTLYYPGWELREFGAERRWFQTDPEYVLSPQSRITLTILDEPVLHRLEFAEQVGGDKVLHVYGERGRTFIIDTSTNLAQWHPFATNVIEFIPTTVRIPPFYVDPALFYKSRLLP